MTKKTKEKERARQLRILGNSIKDIAKDLSVSSGTVSLWVRDIKLPDKVQQALNDRPKLVAGVASRDRWNKKKEEVFSSFVPPNDSRFMFGLGVYWGEGAKITGVAMSNTDPKLLAVFVSWIKEYFQGEYERIKIKLVHYGRLPDVDVKKFWSDKLGIALSNFTKSTIGKDKGTAKTDYGIASVRVQGNEVWRIREKIMKALSVASIM